MKIRILSFLLILVMLFALCACDGEETDPSNQEGNPSQSDTNAGESANKDGQNNGATNPDGGNTNQDNTNPGITNPDGSIDLPFVPF